MEVLYLGKFKGVHGIKGELKLDKIINSEIKKGDFIIIDNKEYEITSLRIHKDLYLITINNMMDINLVFELKNKDVYIKRENIKEELIPEDLLEFEVICESEYLGKVIDIINGKNLLLQIDLDGKKYYIPYYADFIDNIDKTDKKIYVLNSAKGLII